MSNFKLSSTALLCLLIIPSLAHSLELGKVEVYSGLHENLKSKIALQLLAEDLNSKSIVEIAPADKMLQAGIVFNDNLHKIHVKRVGTSINVYSSTALDNPKVDLLLKISSEKEVKYRRVNLNLKELTELTSAVIDPVLLSGDDINLLSQPVKKKKPDSAVKNPVPKNKKVESTAKNNLIKIAVAPLPIASPAPLSVTPDNLTTQHNDTPVDANTSPAYVASQVTQASEQVNPSNAPIAAASVTDIKAVPVVEQSQSPVYFDNITLIALLIAIISILSHQLFKRPKVSQTMSPPDLNDKAYEYTFTANKGLGENKIEPNPTVSLATSDHLNAKASPYTSPFIAHNTDDFDFDLDFNLHTRNKPPVD